MPSVGGILYARVEKNCKGERQAFRSQAHPHYKGAEPQPSQLFHTPYSHPHHVWVLSRDNIFTALPGTTKIMVTHVGRGMVLEGQVRPYLNGPWAQWPQFLGLSTYAHVALTHSNRSLHGDQTTWNEHFYWVNHSPGHRQRSSVTLTRPLMCDLLAVANLLVILFFRHY